MNRIAEILLDWYAREGRDLPWRRTRDPYRIWLSEVILQQTRVAQGMEYYLRFTERFPDVASLAAAPEDEVLKLWQGLGYYSRARNLRAAASEVVERFGGVFPRSLDDVRSLRGVGDYTAAAICSAAYDAPCAVVDGNVYRVLSRLFDLAEPIDATAGKRAFACLAQSQLDAAHPGRYNQAIMDFGAIQCTPASPRCEACPLSESCLALAAGTVADRPVKRGKTRVRDRWFNYLHVASGDGPWHLVRSVSLPRHQLSHQRLHAVVHRIETPAFTPAAAAMAVPADSLGDYAVPRLVDRYLMQAGSDDSSF